MSSPSDRLAQLETELAELKTQMKAPAPRRFRRFGVARRFAILGLALAMLIPAGVVLASHQFNDVPTSHQFHADIDAIADAGITFGCPQGTNNYCPNGLVTRGQMAAFLNRLGALSPGKAPKVNANNLDGLDSAAFARPLYAVVNADGSLGRGVGASSVAGGTGIYRVLFNRNVRECSYSASIGLSGATGSEQPGFITVVGDAISVNGVFVTTHNSAGTLAARGFHLTVMCAGQTGGTAGILETGDAFTPAGAGTSGVNQR